MATAARVAQEEQEQRQLGQPDMLFRLQDLFCASNTVPGAAAYPAAADRLADVEALGCL